MKDSQSALYRIPARDQVLIVEAILEVVSAIEREDRADALEALSRLAAKLEPGARWTEMAHLFDLGEWLFERSQHQSEQRFDLADETWASEAYRSMQASLGALRRM
jgi:hypothetical protein